MTSAPFVVEHLAAPSVADRDAIIALQNQAFRFVWTPDSFDEMLSTPASRMYVTRDATGRIVAFCAAYLFDDELHINTIAVDPRERRRGIGSGLIRGILGATGARHATLEVRESNAPARRMYERLGFKVTAVRRAYYQNPEENGLILWLDP